MQALANTEKTHGSNHLDIAYCLANLGLFYENTGQFNLADDCYTRSLAIRKSLCGENHQETARSLNYLALLYKKYGRYAESEEICKRSLSILEANAGINPSDTAHCLNCLADIYIINGRLDEAEKLFQRALSFLENVFGHNHSDVALCLNKLAILSGKKGCYEESRKYFLQALFVLKRVFGLDHPDIALCLFGFANLYRDVGQLASAIFLSKISVNIIQKLRRNVSDIGKETLASFDKTVELYYDSLAELLINAGRYGEAEFVMSMYKEIEQFELFRRDRQVDLPKRTISYNDVEAPLVARYVELINTIITFGSQEDALLSIIERNPEQNHGLAVVGNQLTNAYSELAAFFDNLHEALPTQEVTQIDQDSYKLINMVDADANTVAIFTVTAEDGFHAVMVTPFGRKAFSAEHKATDIAKKVLKFRELLKDPDDPDYLALSQELYDIIIRPMEGELLSGEYTNILWMLNGALRLLPLAALYDGKQFLLEKFRNVCITTCSTIGQQPHTHWNGLGMGVTREHEGHSPLPAVKEELEGIISVDSATGIMPGDILLDEAFTRDAMESHLEDGYKAVHIASHFELNPANETMSYLLLGDGSKIRMDELRSIPRLFKGVDLVAFSACSTGLGTASTRGREVDGIGYLGEMQGAKTVMATLWPVEDNSTSKLMREFYRLREAGMTTAEALRQAQLCLLKAKATFTSDDGHDFTHPYFWAPFILIGNGS